MDKTNHLILLPLSDGKQTTLSQIAHFIEELGYLEDTASVLVFRDSVAFTLERRAKGRKEMVLLDTEAQH